MTHSQLDGIPGIGPKTIEKLFKRFKSLEGIRSAPMKDLEAEIGARKGQLIRAHLKI
jgi:excinuclease ABC subunit C